MKDITKKTVWGPRIFMFWILFLFRLFDTMSMAIIFFWQISMFSAEMTKWVTKNICVLVHENP